MSLTCSCRDDYDWYYIPPQFYCIFDHEWRKRCCSCHHFIKIGSYAGKFESFKFDESGKRENLNPNWMCETCTDIFFTLEELGYCIVLKDNMKDLLKQYHAQKERKRKESELRTKVKRLKKRKTKRFLKPEIRRRNNNFK